MTQSCTASQNPLPQSLLCLFCFFRRMKYSNDIYFRGERGGNCWKSHSEPTVCLDPWRQTLTPAPPPTALRHLMVGLLSYQTPALPCPALTSLGAQEMMATIHSKPQGKFYVWAGLESSQSPSSDVPSHMQRVCKRVGRGITLPLLSDLGISLAWWL